MGAYSPAPVVTPTVHARVMREVIKPAIDGMAADGHPFSGFLYAGLMIDGEGKARVVEFNARLGDPEAQVLLMRLKSDLFELLMAATDAHGSGVRDIELQWDRRSALGVVMAAAGYPAKVRQGDLIEGLPAATEDMHVFHAGTQRREDGEVFTHGGRVLTVTALGEPLRAAQQRAYQALESIRFPGMQFRRDIGHRALKGR
jgi:phosphoribosylamine--glycine ligase